MQSTKNGPLALIFDLDGTLVDSAPDIADAANRTLTEFGRPSLSLDRIKGMIGDGVAVLLARAFAATGGAPDDPDAALARFHTIYGDAAAVATRPYPGVPATLERLQAAGHIMGVCTNKPEAPTRAVLDALGLTRFFSAWCGGDSLPVRKPHPDHVLGTLAKLGGIPARAAMIGDSINDVTAAKEAGMPCIAVAYGYAGVPVDELGADLVIARFAELPEALCRLRPHVA